MRAALRLTFAATALTALGCSGSGSAGGAIPDGGGGSSAAGGGDSGGTGGGGAAGGSGGAGGAATGCAAQTIDNSEPDMSLPSTALPLGDAPSDLYTEFMTGDVATAENLVVVGMPAWLTGAMGKRPSALAFRFDGSAWSLEGELVPPNLDDGRYGRFVEVSRSGETAIVSTAEVAYVFRREGDAWVGGDRLEPFDGPEPLLGAVAVTDLHAFVAYYHTDTQTGSVYVYRRNGSTWEPEQHLTDDEFDSANGTDVSADDRTVVIVDRSGKVLVFDQDDDGVWQQSQRLSFSGTPALDRNRLAANSSRRVKVLEREPGGEFVECASLPCNEQCDASLYGDHVVTGGAPSYGGDDFGRLYRLDGSEWRVDRIADFEATHVDVGSHFAVELKDGFEAEPIQVVQLRDWP